MKTIKVKYKSQCQERIGKITIGDWIDLRAAETIIMKAGEFKFIPLGVSIELPEGYEALLVPRSSTFKNFGIMQTNSIGIIDEAYCGPNDWWCFPAYAVRETKIEMNDRICQFRIIKHQPNLEIIEVNELSNIDRGGLGSTGTK